MSSKNKLNLLNADHAKEAEDEESSNPKKFKKNNSDSDKRVNKSEDRPSAKKFVSRRHEAPDEDDDSDVDDDEELKISREDIDFNLPKPGPHAKSNEWRKWKQMQRAIRQIREEKRILKREKLERQKKEQLEQQQSGEQDSGSPAGRSFTLSIAIPGSIFGKVQSRELKTYVAGQIARAAVLFCVDEIIVYNDYSIENAVQTENTQQLIKILEYLECPQYLRKSLFPPHKHLEYVGLLNPLEALHHFKIDDDWTYREGVVTDIPCKEGHGSYVDIGLYNKVQVDKKLQPGIRVTVKRIDLQNSHKLRGVVVSPETPRCEDGIYWGYQVRNATSFRKVIYETSFKETYDLKIAIPNGNKMSFDHLKGKLPRAKHILVVFGGKDGIEAALEADEKLRASKIEQVFNFNCEPASKAKSSQSSLFGSRTIRLEEALLISLALLRPHILQAYDTKEETNGDKSAEIVSSDDEDEDQNNSDDDGDDGDDAEEGDNDEDEDAEDDAADVNKTNGASETESQSSDAESSQNED